MIGEFIIASIAITLLPGPDILFVLTQSLTRGARAAFFVSLGLCSGLVFHTVAVACGVAILVVESPAMFTVLKYCGAVYMVYLGVRVVIDFRRHLANGNSETEKQIQPLKNHWSLYRQGITMNLLNPKVLLFFLSFLPGFVNPETDYPTRDVFTLGALFIVQALVVFTLVSLLGGRLNRWFRIERYTQNIGFVVATVVLYLTIAVLIVC